MNSTDSFSSFVSVTRCVICWCSAFWIFGFSQFGVPSGIDLLPFWAMSIAVLVILKLFLRKSRPVNSLLAVAAVLGIIEAALILLFFLNFDDIAAAGIAVVAVATTVVISVFLCTEPVSMARRIASMELTVVFLVFFLWIHGALKIDFQHCLPLFFAAILSIADIVHQRISIIGDSKSQTRTRSIAVVSAVLLLVFAAALLFIVFGVDHLGYGMQAAYHAVIYCLKMLVRIVIAFIMWLESMLPKYDSQAEYDFEKYDFKIPKQAQIEEVNPVVAIIICAAALLMLIAFIVFGLYSIRKVRIGGSKTAANGRNVHRSKNSFLKWIKSLISAVYRKVLLNIRIMLNRGSAKELYIFLTKAGRTLGFCRRKGETPCAFVIRASEVVGEAHAEMESALNLLSKELSIALYSKEGQRAFPKEEAALIRSGFRKALRHARMERLKAKVAAVIKR